MDIKEITDNNWIIDISQGRIEFDLNENKAYFFKKKSRVLSVKFKDAPVREWDFDDDDITGMDVLLVIMKSLHL